MRKDGYEDDFAACFIASVSVVGAYPPGLLYVIYGVSSGTPIAYLFEAGVVPGIMVGLALALVILSCRGIRAPQMGDSTGRAGGMYGVSLNQPLFNCGAFF